jgi:hypothetical protein
MVAPKMAEKLNPAASSATNSFKNVVDREGGVFGLAAFGVPTSF